MRSDQSNLKSKTMKSKITARLTQRPAFLSPYEVKNIILGSFLAYVLMNTAKRF